MLKFINFIKESNNKYDYEFGQYSIDEKPLRWSKSEQEECKSIFGNVDVGIVYHGNRINSLEQLEYLTEIENGNIKTFKCNLLSATPEYSTARSFCDYIKTYDTSSMLYHLSNTYDNGSAGKYGGFVIKLKPKKEQVILSTFNSKNKLSRVAETECLLSGEIDVISIEIYKPLTKDNYMANLEILDFIFINKYDFFWEWASRKKIKLNKEFFIKKFNELNNYELEELMIMDNSTIIEFNDVKNNYKLINILKDRPIDDNFNMGINFFNLNDLGFRRFITDLYRYKINEKIKELSTRCEVRFENGIIIINKELSSVIRLYKIKEEYISNKNIKKIINNLFDEYESFILSKGIIEMLDYFNEDFFHLNQIDKLILLDSVRADKVIRNIINILQDSRSINDVDNKSKYIRLLSEILPKMISKLR